MVILIESSQDTVERNGQRCYIWRGHDDQGQPVALFVLGITYDVEPLEIGLALADGSTDPVSVELRDADDITWGLPAEVSVNGKR